MKCSSSSHLKIAADSDCRPMLHSNVTLFGYLACCGVIANFTDDAKHHSHCSQSTVPGAGKFALAKQAWLGFLNLSRLQLDVAPSMDLVSSSGQIPGSTRLSKPLRNVDCPGGTHRPSRAGLASKVCKHVVCFSGRKSPKLGHGIALKVPASGRSTRTASQMN